ncbi:MAG TPA: iron dicitrate transport regulator FecR [Burkholderiales bacterium]|nr:iron dicitrate transport regulator FecR [Burkholderiales bacterium]
MTPSRRRALLALGGAGLHCVLRAALAQSAVQGVRTARGQVRVNGKPGAPGTPVRAGDTIEIGKNALATFVVGQDAFLMRGDSRAELSGSGAAVAAVRLFTGALLSVFGGGEHRLVTSTATIGVRGTGAYVEAEPWRTYFCLCYGTAEVAPEGSPLRESYSTTHHDLPKYIYGDGRRQAIAPANVSNHTDAELVLLESLVGRSPPSAFMDSPFKY